MAIYEKIGLKPVINARGHMTSLGNTILPKEVREAMVEASKHYVLTKLLRNKVGEAIAKVTGTEAGCVSCGAAAGISMMTAACIARTDPVAHGQLPNTQFPKRLKNELIVPHHMKIGYLKCAEIVGAKVVEVGVSGSCSPRLIEAAINENTAAIFTCIAHSVQFRGHVRIPDIVKIGKKHNIPVIADLAAVADLKYPSFAELDLATFSGGKFLGCLKASGIICGRKDLIRGCEMAASNIAVGMNVGKEQMVALMKSLELYEKRDWKAEYMKWERKAQYIYDKLSHPPIPHVKLSICKQAPVIQAYGYEMRFPIITPPITVRLLLDEKALGITVSDVFNALCTGDPPIVVADHWKALRIIEIEPHCLLDGEEDIVIQRMREVLTKREKPERQCPY